MVEKVTFTNLCRVIGPDGRWLMQKRSDKNYPGIIFPGGHVEKGETFHQSVIREVKEETGLTILNPVLRGIRHWPDGDIHYVIFLYEATKYTGTLTSSDEGSVFWAKPEEAVRMDTTKDFEDNLLLLNKANVMECSYREKNGEIIKIIE